MSTDSSRNASQTRDSDSKVGSVTEPLLEDSEQEQEETESRPSKTKQPKRSFLRIVLLLTAFLIVGSIIAIVNSSQVRGPTEEDRQRDAMVEEAIKKVGEKKVEAGSGEKTIIRSDRALEFPDAICNVLEERPPGSTTHPLDTPLEVALMGLKHIRETIDDYTATLVKQERVHGKLLPQEIAQVKIRSEKKIDGVINIPLHVYLKFVSPQSIAGREVIWIRGRNDNKIVAHEAGILGLVRVNLAPDKRFAMKGNRYPISEIGIETLAFRMFQKGQRDTAYGECIVEIDRNASIDERPCTKIRIEHPVKRDYFEYHIAEIVIDDQHNIPVHYASYLWPDKEGGKPVLLEKYTYLDVELNPGLPDSAFDPDNEAYDFP